ncbi:MAG TPA: monovalent cation/H(+) antiporter subunit G [Egibacteraceae bacterium]|nr:monovalent cation/H(+) antiporter subunit G [Actinomycetota bacterium]HWB72035.1 monovalent cation/H(+) antiporter subunit G [Egibacteraceae bacterium]
MLEVLASVLLSVGVAVGLLGGIGLHRFGSVYARLHAATKPASLGLVLVLTGVALQTDDAGDAMKLVLVIVFQLLTAPVVAHLLSSAAYRAGAELGPTAEVDELATKGPTKTPPP